MKPLLLALAFLALSLHGEPLDKSSTEALNDTLDILRDSTKRKDVIKGDPKAQAADSQVKSVAGDEQNTQRIYELSALIMQNLVQQTGGDVDKMMKIIQAAEKDPAAFANTWSPEQKKMLKELGKDIEKKGGGKSVP